MSMSRKEEGHDPLSPSMANTFPASRQNEKEKELFSSDTQNLVQRVVYPQIQPQFGQTTPLGASPQPYSKVQPLSRPGIQGVPQRQGATGKSDKYSNLFISSKTQQTRPELHKPKIITNPLQQLTKPAQSGTQARVQDGIHDPFAEGGGARSELKKGSTQSFSDDDDVFEIPKPANFPSWQPKPISKPVFSSSYSNSFYQPVKKSSWLPNDSISSKGLDYRDSRHEDTDPYTYVDVGKATENIKALLEGAFEDEDDSRRAKSKVQRVTPQVDELVDGMQKVNVKEDEANQSKVASKQDDKYVEDDDATIEGLKVKLLPHQVEGVIWMREKEIGVENKKGAIPKGGILADDMGLGKTVQAIALMLSNKKPSSSETAKNGRSIGSETSKATLVVAPLALIKQWEAEIKDKISKEHAFSVCVHHGPSRAKSFKDLKKYDVVITTYQTLSSEHANSDSSLKVGCYGINWYRVILDEAHTIKNRNAKSTKAAYALNAEYRWCLTGTPMQNNLDELQSLIHFLRIKPYEDINAWKDQITRPLLSGKGGLAIKRLQVYLKAFMKRRTKDVLKQNGTLKTQSSEEKDGSESPGFKIVKRTVKKIEAEFSPEESAFYKRLESRADRSLEAMMMGNKMSYASALVLLLRLRQACNHPSLTGSDLSQEKDALSGSQTPSRRKTNPNDDMDAIADMLGGLSVQTRRCDMCQTELSSSETTKGAIRCDDCETDLKEQKMKSKLSRVARKVRKSTHTKSYIPHQSAEPRRNNRRVLEDSDDEENGNEEQSIASESKREQQGSGKAGGFGDEDIEGGGKWLSSQSEDTEEEEDEIGSETGDDSEDSELYRSEKEELGALASSTKIQQLLSILASDCHQHKYIVFSFFTSMLNLIEPFLKAKGFSYVRYDGKMRNDMREASLDKLRNDPKTRILLCSLRAGSLGLNLTAASRVVILEPFWNPFVEEQAIDRVHRLNQTQDVIVYKMTIRNTVEARILELQEKKRELANATIEGKTGGLKLTLQDMIKLFSHDGVHAIDMIGMRDGRGLLDTDNGQSTSSPVSQTHSYLNDTPQRPSRPTESAGGKRKEHLVYGRRW